MLHPISWSLMACLLLAAWQDRGGRLGRGGPKVGEPAHDFKLKTVDQKKEIQLSSFKEKSPVVLIFGSWT